MSSPEASARSGQTLLVWLSLASNPRRQIPTAGKMTSLTASPRQQGHRWNRHRPASIRGLSTENMCQAHAKATGALGVGGTNPTFHPGGGSGTTVQDPDGFGGCRWRYRSPNPPPAAHWQQHPGRSGCSRKEPAGPGPNTLPRERSCPQPSAPCPEVAQPISCSADLQSAGPAKPRARQAPCACRDGR